MGWTTWISILLTPSFSSTRKSSRSGSFAKIPAYTTEHIQYKAYGMCRVVRPQLVRTEEHLKHKQPMLYQSVILSHPPHTMSNELSSGSR